MLGISLALTFFVLSGATSSELGSSYQKHYHEYDHYSDPLPVTEQEVELHYHPMSSPHRYRPSSEKGLDLTSIGILAIIKLLIIKIKGLGIGLFLLLKLPLVLLAFFGKLLVFFKAAKILKLLALPIFFFAPLLLLAPLLLPLLLSIPVPVVTQTNTGTTRQRRETDSLAIVHRILESEKCMERIACAFASDKDPFYSSSISWGLDMLKPFVQHPKMDGYVSSFKDSAERNLTRNDCFRKYACKHNFFLPRKLVKKST